ncbi:MAG TPA: SLBB domain-containing protein, partial [Bacteroidota bacterium]
MRDKLLALFFFFVSGISLSFSQTDKTGMSMDVQDLEKLKAQSVQTAQPKGLALESTIDPEHYFVGPSDVFSVNVWISPPVSFLLTVTPEGTLIIPTVGEVRVADITLADAKQKVIVAIGKSYRSGNVTMTLVTPRPIVVTVTGNVVNPGSYVLAAYYRADKAIEEANTLHRDQAQAQLDDAKGTMSRRNILIRRKDGSNVSADLQKFLVTKEDKWNPYLREGDVIVVPRTDMKKNVIGVYGEVNLPGRFEFVQGDSVKDAIRIAYGFSEGAVVDTVELTRFTLNGSELTTTILNGRLLFDRREPDIALQPGDRVVVRGRPDKRADYRVWIDGEVPYPGIYPITRSTTKLSQVIAMAGGFTEFASIKTAQLVRRSVEPREIELERLESSRGGVSAEDSLYYYLETELRIRKEIVNVDFERLFMEGDSAQDVMLRDNDVITIPQRRKTVYVFGQVATPGHI